MEMTLRRRMWRFLCEWKAAEGDFPGALLGPSLPRGLPTQEVMTHPNAERTEISAFAVGPMEPLCTHAFCTASPPTTAPPPTA